MTWFEKFAALWTRLGLACGACGHPKRIDLRPFAAASLLTAFGLVPFAVVGGAFAESPRWCKFLLLPIAALVASPFLLFGVLSAAAALGVKCLVYLSSFAWYCPQCRGRKWRVADWGVSSFRSSF